MKIIGLITVILCGGLLIANAEHFPAWGDKASPPATYLSPYFLQNSIKDAHVPNVVTTVLAYYRGYDTMFETTVVFAAGLACFFLLRRFRREEDEIRIYRHKPTGVILRVKKGAFISEDSEYFQRIDSAWAPYSTIVKNTSRLIVPFIQLFAMYVIAHGHYSPGGGFQGGVLLGASLILFAISYDLRTAIKRVSEKALALFSAIGVFIYAGVAALCLLLGSNFLDYSALAPLLGCSKVMARSYGILFVEIGVALAVMAVMTWIYYNLSSAGKHDEGL